MRRERVQVGFKKFLIKCLILYLLVSSIYFLAYRLILFPLLFKVKYSISLEIPMLLGFIAISGIFIFIIHRSLADRLNFPKNSNNEYFRLLRETPTMFHTTDSKGYIVNVSDYWLEVLGYSVDEVMGRYSLDFLTQESKEYFKKYAKEYIKKGYCRDVPCRYVKKNGDIIDVVLSANLLRNKEGLFIGSQTSIADISKLKQVENSLQATEEIFRKIVYTIPDIFIQTDIDGNIVYVNEIGLNFFSKYSTDLIIGDNVLSLIAPEDKDKAIVNLKLMFENAMGPVEYNVIINDSNRFICEINGEVLRHTDSKPYGLVFIIRNITQRKKVERELKASEEKYRSIVETTPDMVWEITPDGRFMYASPQSYEILGYTADELYTMSFFDLIIPEQLNRVKKQFHEDIMLKKRIIAFDVEVMHRISKQKIYLEISSTPILNENDEIIGLRGVTRDITARKLNELQIEKSKEDLEMVLKAGDMGLWFANLVNYKINIDEVWASSLGYSKDEVTGISYDSLKRIFHPDDIERIRDFINSAFFHNSPKCSIEHRMLTKSGDVKWVLSTVKVIQVDSENKPVEVIGLLKDITERKIAELNIIEANATKDKLFSIIAHDLRNPFSSIIGFSELLTKNLQVYSDHKISEMVHHINTSANSIYSLLENLLEWANSQRGKTSFNPKIINLAEVVNEEVDHLNYYAQQKDIVVNLFNINVNIYADYYLLKIIVRNLITNAIKYSNPGEKVSIFALSYADRVEICVSDSGVGMDDEIKNKLFKIGGYASQKGTANESGTGLGLMLCNEFVEKHNGSIWVDSKLGEGSRFTFSLPNQ